MEKFKIKKSHIILLYIAACIIKIILASLQYPVLTPDYAPIDDDLMFDAAVSITNGNWLGDYNYLTISKHMFFSIYLSFIHFLGVPYLVANCIFWIACAFYGIYCFKPVIKSDISLWFLFCGILYNPAISAHFSLRVYRDSIFPIISMFFFFSIIAIGISYKEEFKKLFFHYIIIGLSFGVSYITREDGYWALPFLIVAFSVLVYKWFKNKDSQRFKKTFSIFISIAISILVISSYSYMNYLHYGRFIVSDFTSSDFESAYGALTSIESEEFIPMVSVSQDTREKLKEEVPLFNSISDTLESPLVENAYLNKDINDFKSGSFYWALRLTLELEGIYETAQKSETFFNDLTSEIQTAVDENRLTTYNSSNTLRKSVTPIIDINYVLPTINETYNGFITSLFFLDCHSISSGGIGIKEKVEYMGEYINQPSTMVKNEETGDTHLDLKRIPSHAFLEFMNKVYSVFVPLMFIVSIFWQIKQFIIFKTEKNENIDNMLNLILLGIIGMAILRCAMIAFMEVAAFGIGTYGMYLSTVFPLIIIYTFIGFIKTFEN